MKRRHLLGSLLLCAVLFLGACSFAPKDSSTNPKAKKLKEVTVLLDWTANTNHSGLFLAQKQGFYQQEGLKVTIQTPPEGGASALVGAGKAQFGIDAQDTLAPAFTAAQSVPVTAVAAILSHNTSGILSRKGEGLDRPKGLEGARYATWDNAVEKAMLKNVVETDGGSFQKVTLIPNNTEDEVASLKSKQIDAVWVFYGWSAVHAKLKGFPFDYFSFKDINPVFDYYTPILVASNEVIAKDPDLVRAFLRATQKGYEAAAKDPKAAAKALLEHAGELDDALVQASQEWVSKQYLSGEAHWGKFQAERWNAFYEWLWTNQLIPRKIPENFGFTNDFLP
ncbi:Hydroxymethylpyrimidine ABC transporter, substrate-binding component [Clostridiaceae bacterium JG1575]|nr:Hydroxymethylpyrimidine ABC transporter, substrate-binding component [Clostridiaceae bacterium JG1575]